MQFEVRKVTFEEVLVKHNLIREVCEWQEDQGPQWYSPTSTTFDALADDQETITNILKDIFGPTVQFI